MHSSTNVKVPPKVMDALQVDFGVAITGGGLAEVHLSLKPDERDGFVIITAASDEGHGRHP